MDKRRTARSVARNDPPLTRGPRSMEDYRFLPDGAYILLSLPQAKPGRARLFRVASGKRFTRATPPAGTPTPADVYEVLIQERPQHGTKWNLRKLDVGTSIYWGAAEFEVTARTGRKLRIRLLRVHDLPPERHPDDPSRTQREP